jgi:Arylsulfotransferase (ASST)
MLVAGVLVIAAIGVAVAFRGGGSASGDLHATKSKRDESLRFASRPDLRPPGVTVRRRSGDAAPGKLLVTPKKGAGQDGPMILDERGELVWFRPLEGRLAASDLRVQRYDGEPVLTWWEGTFKGGEGRGEYVIVDDAYRQVARVRAGNGLDGDLHEFLLTPRGTALVTIYKHVRRSLESVGGPRKGRVLDSIVQEIDVETGKVIFEWRSLGAVGLDESYKELPEKASETWDYFHVNSIDVDDDGNLLVSARNTHAVYKLGRRSGRIIWRLGGKRSDFRMGRGTRFAWAHDARRQRDGSLTVFDNGSSPKVHDESRGIVLDVDDDARRVTLRRAYTHPRGLSAPNQGNMQVLPEAHVVVGWGAAAHSSEFSRDGKLLFDMRFTDRENDSYRAYRAGWTGRPSQAPALAVRRREGGRATVYASWNGATEVARWEVLAGPSRERLKAVGSAPRKGFETAIRVDKRERYVAVRARDRDGEVLATSKPTRR